METRENVYVIKSQYKRGELIKSGREKRNERRKAQRNQLKK